MHLEYALSYDDFAEASRSHAAARPARRGAGSLVGWVVFVGLAAVLLAILSWGPNAPAPGPAGPTTTPAVPAWLGVMLPLVPWLLVFGFIWFFVFRQMRRSAPQSFLYASNAEADRARAAAAKPGGGLRNILTAVVVIAAGCALIVLRLASEERDGRPWREVLASSALLPFVPWVVVFLFIWVVVFRQLRRSSRQMWEGQPQMQQQQWVDIDDAGIRMADALSRSEYRWDAFRQVRETPNLFVLYTSDFTMTIVPKRAFPDPAAVEQFRETLRRMIADRPAPAFPVLPAGPAPPAGG